MNETSHPVFISGATGYMGKRLAHELVRRRHGVSGLVRAGSEKKVGGGMCRGIGECAGGGEFRDKVAGVDTYVQLVGVAHPGPAKARQFREIDLKSCQESVAVAVHNRVRHFVYVSVAHPTPVIRLTSRCGHFARR